MDAAGELETRIRAAIPLSETMGFRIEALAADAIEVSAPLPPNVNIHGTGFAGSIYSLAVLSGWALCTHMLEAAGIEAELVVARAEISYRAPVNGDLQCRARPAAEAAAAFLRDARAQGKGLLQLDVEVGAGPEALLSATYCALRRRARSPA